jgi:hypothetical protein
MSLLQKCLTLLKQHEFKQEVHSFLYTLLEIILEMGRPYLLWILFFLLLHSITWFLLVYALFKLIRIKL